MPNFCLQMRWPCYLSIPTRLTYADRRCTVSNVAQPRTVLGNVHVPCCLFRYSPICPSPHALVHLYQNAQEQIIRRIKRYEVWCCFVQLWSLV